LSQAYNSRTNRPPHWQTGLRYAPDIIRRVIAQGMPRDVLLNINFPDCAPDDVNRIAVTAQGRRRQERLQIDQRHDGRGNPYYWIMYVRPGAMKAANGTDLAALEEHCIAVTPLRLDMTDEPSVTRLAKLFE
jgi:5'-nucleotidase